MTAGSRVPAGGEEGVAIVWSLALVSILMIVAAVGAAVVGLATVRMKVAGVADLAALAAAQSATDACGAASEVVLANGLTLADCAVDGADVVVTVSGTPPDASARLIAVLGGEPRLVSASARAGPP